MPSLRTRTQTLETPANPNPQTKNDEAQTSKTSLYEQSREERIKENLQRMQKLGIVDLSLKLKSALPHKRIPKNLSSDHKASHRSSPLLPSGPVRRSSRLQNVTPISYSEVVLAKKDGSLEDMDIKLEEGSKPEVYTEEHEKLLGNTEKSWTLFVDGCGKDGRRIYDPVKGKTCHQCRQKTLGHRTQCSKCNMVQGQFCGDCLYMRYGEHVLEAIQDPNWICPVCRGICNCSLCRHAKGWAPTGSLYRKITALGFKSVAHFLIQTRRSQSNLENDPNTINQVPAKRLLSFPDMEALSKECPKLNDYHLATLEPQPGDNRVDDDDFKSEKKNEMHSILNPATNHQISAKRWLPFPDIEAQPENTKSAEINLEVHDHVGLSNPIFKDKRDEGFKCEQEKEFPFTDKELDESNVALESFLKHKKKRAIKSSPDSIAGRLTQRRRKGDCHNDELTGVNENIQNIKQAVNDILPENESEKEMEMHFMDGKHSDCNNTFEHRQKVKKPTLTTEPNPDSVAGRLRQRRRRGDDQDDDKLTGKDQKNLNVRQAVNSTLSEKKCVFAAEPSPDSVTGKGKGHDDEELPGIDEKTSKVEQAVKSISSGMEAELNKKLTGSTKHSPDSIASRLRPRIKTA